MNNEAATLDVEAIRRLIPATQSFRYFNTGGISPSLQLVTDSLTGQLNEIAGAGHLKILDGAEYERRLQAARESLARFMGAPESDVCLTRGVADGVTTVFNGINWQPGDELILTDEEHPAVQIPAERLSASHGAVLRYLSIDGSDSDVLGRLDTLITDRTRMLALSHVTTDTGTRLPARPIVERAHKRDLPVLFDAAQSLGQFDVDVQQIGADFYSCLGYKWMFGPYSTGCLYVHPGWQERLVVVPSGVNYGSTAGARRFEFSLMPATHYIASGVAVDYLQSLGLPRIEAHVKTLARRLRAGLEGIPRLTIESPSIEARSTGIVAFRVDGIDGPHISAALRDHGIITRPTGMKFSGVRFSVALFTTAEEIDAAVDAVADIVERARQ